MWTSFNKSVRQCLEWHANQLVCFSDIHLRERHKRFLCMNKNGSYSSCGFRAVAYICLHIYEWSSNSDDEGTHLDNFHLWQCKTTGRHGNAAVARRLNAAVVVSVTLIAGVSDDVDLVCNKIDSLAPCWIAPDIIGTGKRWKVFRAEFLLCFGKISLDFFLKKLWYCNSRAEGVSSSHLLPQAYCRCFVTISWECYDKKK